MEKRKASKTQETKSAYLKRARRIELEIRRALQDRDEEMFHYGAAVTPMQFALWLEAKVMRNELTKSSLRTFRSSLIYALSLVGGEDADNAIAHIREIKHTGIKREPVGSAKKVKTVSIDDEMKLCSHLISSGSKWGLFSAQWLKFTRMIGFRPCELEKMELTILGNGDYAVIIENAKATNGRSHGEYRTVPLPLISEEDVNELRLFLEQRDERSLHIGFERMYEMVRSTIKYRAKQCFPRRKRRVCLYSMRHQFSANLKASGLTKVEVAALSGHISSDTSGKHYARKKSGSVQPGVYALREEVMRVTRGRDNPNRKADDISVGSN